jgi:hypothetical protein
MGTFKYDSEDELDGFAAIFGMVVSFFTTLWGWAWEAAACFPIASLLALGSLNVSPVAVFAVWQTVDLLRPVPATKGTKSEMVNAVSRGVVLPPFKWLLAWGTLWFAQWYFG